jgi:hypothetical protein
MNRVLLVLLGTIALTVVACRSSEDSASKEKEITEMQKPPDPGPGVLPGHCRIVGSIVSVNPVLSTDGNDPCSKTPCTAMVKVEEIVGYGSGFTAALGKGSEVQIRFQYTLSPSAEIFPGMSPGLPGLKKGSKFQADIKSGPSLTGGDVQVFSVGQYQAR